MKKILLFLSILFVLGAVTNSCISGVVDEGTIIPDPNPNPNPNPPVPGPDPVVTTKTFSFKGYANLSGRVNTYAVVDLSNQTNPIINWSTTDLHYGLFLKGASANSFLFNNRDVPFFSLGNTQSTNSVSVETSENSGILYGYYPYQSSVSGTQLSYNLSGTQDQSLTDTTMDVSLNRNMLMIAEPTSEFSLTGGDPLFIFRNVFSLLRFKVNMSEDFSITNPINNIKLYVAKKNDPSVPLTNYILAGNYTIDATIAPGMANYSGPVFSSTYNIINAKLSNSDMLSNNSNYPSVWLIVNPIKINSGDCLVSVIEAGVYKIITRHEDISALSANTVYGINVLTKRDNIISDNVTTYIPDDRASNSYIISRAGVCQIPIKRINGTTLTGTSVDWLWASKEGGLTNFDISELIDPSSIKFDNPSSPRGIQFRVGTNFGKFTKGNVVLALKNQSGEIVWTWHIWITDEPKDIVYDGRTFIDRNLGAFSTNLVDTEIDNYGFLYQWGRKDPFVGGDGSENETNANALYISKKNTIVNTATTWSPREAAGWSVNATTAGDYNNSVKMPMQFIANGTSPNDQPSDWLSSSNRSLWSATSKTDFDPCPYGYKVPSKDDLRPLFIDNASSTQYFYNIGAKHWTYYYYLGGSTIWPSAGMRQGRNNYEGNSGAQLLHSGTDNGYYGQCFYWTSSPVNIGSTELLGVSHRVYTVSDILYSNDEYGDNADAYSIRCVRYIPATP